MIQVNLDFTDEQFRTVLREEIQKAVADVVKQNQLPPMLTRKQFMELFNISQTKASELLNRADFPVCREAGVLIPSHLLMKWVEKNTRWVDENTDYFSRVI
ncbi:DNA-binding protein [Bacillus sp. JJ722]|uniref:DNA-binding protein n=1 Tax=Bacillus sp. JJ722 TaxID=3122973 RepID=UPI0030008EF7